MESDFSDELLDRYGFSGPLSMWEGMFADKDLSSTIISEIISKYAGIISANIGNNNPLIEAIDAHEYGRLGFRCEMVESEDTSSAEMSLPYIDIVVDEGKPRPKVLINFEEFHNLLYGTPELVATIMQFIYLNYRLISNQGTIFPQPDGTYYYDISTIWGMNIATATTLIALNVDKSRYSMHSNNALSPEQRTFYANVLDDVRDIWEVPSSGPFVLN